MSLTGVYDGQNILVSQFSSREEVIQVSCLMRVVQLKFILKVVLASCFIPIFSGLLPPVYRGTRVIGEFVLNYTSTF